MCKVRSQAWIAFLGFFLSGVFSQARDLPDQNVLASRPADRSIPVQAASARYVKPGTDVQADLRFGLPTFVWASSRPVPADALDPKTAALAYLREYVSLYRLTEADFGFIEVGPVHDTGQGVLIVQLRERIDGLEVQDQRLSLAMNRKLELISIAGYLSGAASRAPRQQDGAFRLSQQEALGIALQDLGLTAPGALQLAGQAEGGYQLFQHRAPQSDAETLIQPARVKAVYFHLPEGLEPAYFLSVRPGLKSQQHTEAYTYVVSAQDGRILSRRDGVVRDSFTYRVWAQTGDLQGPLDGPHADYSPNPTGLPDGNGPGPLAPVLITLESGPRDGNDPWLASDATGTRGNNADAYADLMSPDGFGAGDLRATTTSTRTFDRTFDPNQPPQASQNQRMAAVTQLFYTVNWLHDWFYDAGFDEASGNAQQDNYGRGGVAGDPLLAEAQDYSGLDNANMSPGADGDSPRMQMYLWSGPDTSLLRVTTPALGDLNHAVASYGPTDFDRTANLILANDGSGTTTDACQPLVNTVTNRIVLVDRGTCPAADKALNVQQAGGVGMIQANNAAGLPPMAGTGNVTIGSLGISQADGNTLKTALSGTVTVQIQRRDRTRDGTLDNQIVAHEWGHYISLRLVPIGNNQGGSMSEGWGDFHALLITARQGDNFQGVYPISGYTTTLYSNSPFYFGLRRYPYSLDFNKNPLTFRHIQDGVSLPSGPPINPIPGVPNSEVHNSGEVWATMLWECYGSLLQDSPRLTFEQARDRMRRYLVASYKLTPSNPTFVEARDALLAAMAANDPADFDACAQAFARRGMGSGAVAPDRFSEDHSGVVESYVLAPDPQFESAQLGDVAGSCDTDGILDSNESGTLTVRLRNQGVSPSTALTATVTSSNGAVSFPGGNTLSFPATAPQSVSSAVLPVQMGAVSGFQALDFAIVYGDPNSVPPGDETQDVLFSGNANLLPMSSTTDSFSSPFQVWTPVAAQGSASSWRLTSTGSAFSNFWHGDDVASLSDHSLVSPPIQVAASGNFILSFKHRHRFEFSDNTNWDGGVIEFSTNGGTNWADIATIGTPGYGGVLSTEANNPLGNRQAYVSQSTGYPDFQTVSINVGTSLASQTVRFRFRIGCDEASGADGWDIDDVSVTGASQLIFPSVIQQGVCVPTATPTLSPTPSWTLTATRTVTPTWTGTAPFTATFTPTPGISPSFTPTPGISPSFTPTPLTSPTGTGTSGPSPTSTATATIPLQGPQLGAHSGTAQLLLGLLLLALSVWIHRKKPA